MSAEGSAGHAMVSSARRPTAADVAKKVGVSRATVGYVLNNTPGQKISDSTKQRIREAALEIGYRPHTSAQALARGNSTVVLLIIPDWPSGFTFSVTLDAASEVLEAEGYTLVAHTPPRPNARPLWDVLEPVAVVGITPFTPSEMADIRAAGVQHIFPSPDQARTIARPEGVRAGPTLQVRHLAERGHFRLGIATDSDPRIVDLVAERTSEARDEIARLGLAEPVIVTAGTVAEAATAVSTLHAANVTGVVAYNDDVAARVISATLTAGRTVPTDLAVIGHDDTPLASLLFPALTSVHIDAAEGGRALAAGVLAALNGTAFTPDGAAPTTAQVIQRAST